MKNILLFKGQSQYGALRMHTDYLGEAFKALGYNPVIVDLLEGEKAFPQIESVLNQGCLFVFSFNGMGIDLKAGKESIYNLVNVPYLTALVDHPHYHRDRLSGSIKKLAITCLDYSHLRFLKEIYGQDLCKVQSFMMAGGTPSNLKVEQDMDTFFQKRNIPVLFTGTFNSLPTRTWTNNSDYLVKILNDVCDYALSQERLPIEEALDYVLQEKNLHLDTQLKNKLKFYSLEHIGAYIRGYRRYKIIETIGKAGVPLHVYGHGWEKATEQWNSIKNCGVGTTEQTLDLLTQTRIALNVNNNFYEGGHERIFNAMINGSAVLSDQSLFYEQEFIDGEEILLYPWLDLDQIPEKINELLDNPEKNFKMAQAGKRKVEENHLWIHRAEQILTIAELANII